MRLLRFSAVTVVAAAAALSTVLAARPAAADDQIISAKVTLSGFTNSNVSVGFTTTDVFDGVHQCNVANGSSCAASNGYGSPPKNVENFLCIPNAILYTVSSACNAVLANGSSSGCRKNPAGTFCPSGTAAVIPLCDWRTGDNKSPVNWFWTVTNTSSGVTVDCSNTNYQGPTQ